MSTPIGRSDLDRILARRMAEEGPMPFSRFMEEALYHPDHGYYRREGRIGRGGDFLTSVSVGDLFGLLLCERLAGWTRERRWSPVRWVEAGAHDGRLACDILDHCRAAHGDLYSRLRYEIVEPDPAFRARQAERLSDHAPRVAWRSSLGSLPPGGLEGILFSNELLDALPVERLRWDRARGRWIRCGVGWEGGRFQWRRMEALDPRSGLLGSLAAVPSECLERLRDGFATERGRRARDWWKSAARRLGRGLLATVDYGLPTLEFLMPHRAEGTLRAYRGHRVSGDLLDSPGEQDLTSHVDFSELSAAGEEEGLRTRDLVLQERFLSRALEEGVRRGAAGEWMTPRRMRQWGTLAHPEGFGRSFRVLVQERA